MKHTIILNTKPCSIHDFLEVVRSLADKRILAEKGGYLFKAAFIDGDCHIGIVPWVLDGQRTHHYDIHLINEDMFTLIGSIDAKGEWNLLFKPEKGKRPSATEKARLAGVYRDIAALFIDSDLPYETPLSRATGLLLTQAGICTENPISLGSLINI